VLLALLLAAAGAGMLRSERSYNHTGYGGSRLLVDPDAELVVAFYMVEHGENDDCKNNSRAANVLYSALD
jgi:CubicO group peptidase (beta-lactamase class C family)